MRKIILDWMYFGWLILGLGIYSFWGLFRPRAPKSLASGAKDVLSWTSRFIAPASEKVLDYAVARELVERYFTGGITLDVAFGAGRFEEQALEPIIARHGAIDGIDLEREIESNVEKMQQRPWVRKALKRSYLATGFLPESYQLLFCNNGLMATRQLPDAFQELARITALGGHLIFNMVSKTAQHYTYRTAILSNRLLGRWARVRFWEDRADKRLGCHYDPAEIKSLLEAAGWEVLEVRHYLNGGYMRWHYLFNFPCYDRFYYYASTGEAPLYYAWMKKIWQWWLPKVALAHLQGELTKTARGYGAKFYVVACKRRRTEKQGAFIPKQAFIDVVYGCNLRCVMCDLHSPLAVMPYSHPQKTFMDMSLFKSIIDQTAGYIQSYCVQLRGEPLLHPDYPALLAYCRSKAPQCNIYFNTNGLLLTPEKANQIVSAGVNGIYFSLDALSGEIYKKIRLGSDFNKVMANIEYLLSVRSRSPVKLEVGVSFVVQDKNRHEQEAFMEFWSKKVEYVIFYAKAELDRSRNELFFVPEKKRGVCAAINQDMAVLVDGTVVPCCGATGGEVALGDLNSQSVDEILASPKALEFRAKVMAQDLSDLPLCRNCKVWMANEVRLGEYNGMLLKQSPLNQTYYCSVPADAEHMAS